MDLKNKTLARSNRTNNLHCGNNSGTKMHPALAMKSGLTTLWIAFCFILLLNVGARAQAISGDLIGTVEDATGAAVPNATLTITNINTNAKATATSNDAGQYRFSNLIPGTYDLTASASGFGTTTLKNVTVTLNQVGTANITLEVGAVQQSVTVTEAAVVLDTTSAQIQNTYTTVQAQNLPSVSIGNGVINLSLLQSGVTSSGGVGVGTGPSIGGQRPRNNNYMVEGIDNNSKSVTGPQVFLPNDAVAEFTLLQNQFRAEYGHSSGGQFNTIVRTGTNAYHGMIYEYLRNRDLNALDQTFKNQGIFTKQRYDQNRLGGQVGGPILKNKLFFFANFEYNPLGRASTVGSPVYAPTAAGYSALAAAPGVSKTNLGVVQTYAVASAVTPGAPNVTVGGVTVPTGIIPITAPNFTNGYYGILSADYNMSDHDQIRGRMIYNKSDAINTVATLPVFYTTVPSRTYLATLAEYHTFNPGLTNEARLGYQRYNSSSPVGDQQFPGLDQFPNLAFNDLSLQVGPNPNFPQFTIQNLYQLVDNVSWIRGRHSVKFGYEFRDSISPQLFSQRIRGDYQYVNFATYLLDQNPDYLAQRNVGGRNYYGNQLAHYAFAQDTWRITEKLTLDLGLRYEVTTVPKSMQDQALNSGASAPPLLPIGAPKIDRGGWAPRVGVAYSPDRDKTVVRAGFGLAYDVIFDNVGLNTVPPQYAVTVDQTGGTRTNFLQTGGINSASVASGGSVAALRSNTSSYMPDQLLPYSVNWNFGVQRTIGKDYTFEARYVGTRGVHQILQQQINRKSLVTATNNIPTYMSVPSLATLQSLPLTVGQLRTAGSLDPQYAALGFNSTITSYRPEGWNFYNGLALQLTRRFANGLQFLGAYTWSHNIDNSTAEVASTYLTPRRAQNFDRLSDEKADSALDRRHRFTFSAVYDAPWYKKHSNWMARNLIGNWIIAPVYTYESPELFTVQSGIDSNLNGDSAPDRTILNPSGAAHTGSNVYGLDRSGNRIELTAATAARDPIVAYVAVDPNARYIRAGYGAYANGARNTEPTRPINNVDLSVLKRFNVTERVAFEIGAQGLNLFNHPQFVPGSLNNTAPVNTFTSATLNYVSISAATISTGTFNNPERVFSSSPRQLLIVGKITF